MTSSVLFLCLNCRFGSESERLDTVWSECCNIRAWKTLLLNVAFVVVAVVVGFYELLNFMHIFLILSVCLPVCLSAHLKLLKTRPSTDHYHCVGLCVGATQ